MEEPKMGLEEYKGVYIYAQQVDNKLSDIAFELVGKAKELAADLNTEVTAVLLGSNVKALATELGEYGADKVIVVDNPALETYRTEPYAQALVSVINEYKPEIMLVGATAIGRDLGPTVSARVKTGLTADCTMLEIGDFPLNAAPGQEQQHNQLLMTRPAFGGNTIATIAANIEVLIIVNAFGMEMTLGNILFASTFLVTDILSELYGKKEAQKAVYLGIATSVIFICISQSVEFLRKDL